MKFVLTASLLANIAFIAALSMRLTPSETASALLSPRPSPPLGQPDETAALAVAWAHAKTGDLHDLVGRLRAAGVTPSATRALVMARVDELYATKRKNVVEQSPAPPFWQPQSPLPIDQKMIAALGDLSREQADLLMELLGVDYAPENPLQAAFQRRQFGDLPPGKRDQLQRIATDYMSLELRLTAESHDAKSPETRDQLALLEKEKRADLEKILTPQELEEHDLRSSKTSLYLRNQLASFKPSEAEYRALFRATRAAEETLGSIAEDATRPNAHRRVQASVLERAKQFFTPERYADFTRTTDFDDP